MSANHDRNVREAMELAEKLPPFEAEIIKRLCRSSRQSKALNQRYKKEYRQLYVASKQVAEKTREECAAKIKNFRAHLNFEALLDAMRDEQMPPKAVAALSDLLDGLADIVCEGGDQ